VAVTNSWCFDGKTNFLHFIKIFGKNFIILGILANIMFQLNDKTPKEL